MRECMVTDASAAKVLFIIDDDGRDSRYQDACAAWDINADIEHVPYQGLCKAVEDDFDLIIVDDYLSQKSGYTLALEIMDRKQTVIFMLGKAMDDVSVVGAFRMGIMDYMSCRISPAQLAARCLFTIRRLHAEREHKIRYLDGRISVADVVLDTRSGMLEIGDRRIELLKMEAVILQVLMEHADSILSKKEIYEKAWEEAYLEGENSVATHISKLRKKMENAGTPRYIETKWGVGYRFLSTPVWQDKRN